MHGRIGDGNRKLIRHMWPVSSTTTTTAVVGVSDSNGSSSSYLFKDGRKIIVGDCALFKPAKDTPPFVGIIRCLTSKESNLTLRVNWLYRPGEVKLLKGVALETSPNEVFYSFHSDEIPAASLLHPCKVAFLPKGVELPPGVSSFVCRRVYDITSKFMWWMTDQDYFYERKEEIYKLLQKTRIEMNASVEPQQGPRSPRPVNGSGATSPLKHSPDSVPHSSSNLPCHKKGKKRERGDQCFDAIKRERSSKPGDGQTGQLKSETTLNTEIAKVAEKGGLMDSEAVVRLVRLMQPDKSEKKIDLTGRSILAGTIAVTDKLDCLNKFVQLRGLHVLNEWLQEVHKGKIGGSGNIKHNDKFVDDYLLVLLRALDKLPVNLNALQMCNIGKSVNHLRSHKNSEIQKKARSLVDTWKKRVEAEMNVSDVKPGSSQAVLWPGRSQHDSSHGGNMHPGYNAAIRSCVMHHSSVKSSSVKPVQGDSTSKSASAHPGGLTSTLSPLTTDNYKDVKSHITNVNDGSSELQSVVREEKSSSSCQSQSLTNSQCSSDHAKSFVLCGKEDTKKSTAGSRKLNKTIGSYSKHREHVSGASSSAHKETASNKSSSMARNSALEKLSHNGIDSYVPESNNHKLIVKISNRGRGPVQSIAGGFLEDSSCRISRASSPALLEKHDQPESTNKHDSYQLHEADGPSCSVNQKTSKIKKLPYVSKVFCSTFSNEHMSRKVHDSSFSSMNALIESCAKLSEANMTMLAGDDVGMNLLASVAAGEIPKTGNVSPVISPHRNSIIGENSSSTCVGNQKQLYGDDAVQQSQLTDDVDNDNHINVQGVFKAVGESSVLGGVKNDNLHESMEGCLNSNGTSEEKGNAAFPPVSVACTTGRSIDNLGAEITNKKFIAAKEESQNELPVASQEIKVVSLNDEFDKKSHIDTTLYSPNDGDVKNGKHELQSNIALEQKSLSVTLKFDSTKTNVKKAMVSSGTSNHLAAVSNNVKSERTEGVAVFGLACQTGNRKLDKEIDPSVPMKEGDPALCCAYVNHDRSCKVQNSENKDAPSKHSGNSARLASCTKVTLSEAESHSHAEATKLTAMEEETKENSESAAENIALSTASGQDTDTKHGFDLNEGFVVDEGKNGEPVCFGSVRYSDVVCSASAFQIPLSPASCGLSASITVAAAAKGPFVPSDELLWNKGELGWKGSAATSAFRPAEPRKSLIADSPVRRPSRFPLDIDLNVADESCSQELNVRNYPVLEPRTTASLLSSGGLDLDLNKVDEASDTFHMGRHVVSNIQRFEALTQHVKPLTSNVYSNGVGTRKRDFDLNDGPETEESSAEQIPFCPLNIENIPSQPPFGPRTNSSNTGNCYSWYPPGTSYSVSMAPSVLPDREAFTIVGMSGGPQRVVGGPTAAISFNPDVYSGSVLSSSPALPFHPAAFQYPVLPFPNNFPLSTSALASGSSGYMDPTAARQISAIPSQFVGNAVAGVSFQYPHSYVVSRSIPDTGGNSVIGSNHKWGKQGLDLNSGPGVINIEGRDESLPIVSRQVSNINSQTLVDEQATMYSMGGGHLKRKEPEGVWSIDKLNFKQSSWR